MFVNHRNINPSEVTPHTRPRWLAAILGVLICKCDGIFNGLKKAI